MSNASKLVPGSQTTAGASVQKKADGASSGADAMKVQLRGMDYAAGAQALAPGGSGTVQKLSGKVPEDKLEKKKDEKPGSNPGDGTGGGGGG